MHLIYPMFFLCDFVCLKENVVVKKKKICNTSRNSQPLKLDLPEQSAVRKKPPLPPLLSLHGLFHLLCSFCLGPSWSFSESCVIAFDIFGLGLRQWSHREEFNGLASRLDAVTWGDCCTLNQALLYFFLCLNYNPKQEPWTHHLSSYNQQYASASHLNLYFGPVVHF